MSGIVVVIREEQNRDEWIAMMREKHLAFSEFSSLDRIFIVENVSIVTFPLVNHPGYDIIEPKDMAVRSAASQSIDLDQFLETASWGIARIIRRRAPWPTRNGQFPQSAYYRCLRDGSGVDVYIIDSGIRTSHNEFTGRAVNAFDVSGDGPVYFHGTACASLAAGATVGTARGAAVFSFQCIHSDGSGTTDECISAINSALTHFNNRSSLNRPCVMNMSLAYTSTAINSAVSSMINAGIVVVAAAENNIQDLSAANVYPAESDVDVIVTAATTACDTPYYWTSDGTNYGLRVDICAPGQSNYCATNTTDSAYATRRGTSFACAFASGAIACMLQGHPRLTTRAQVQAVRSFVMNTATAGKVRSTPQQALPDRLLYLNPDVSQDVIPGL